jgi:hypothetical protein
MGKEFLNDLNIHGEGQIQFKTSAGANAGKIDQSGNDLVLSNAVGDIIIGNGSDDVYIGDGTNAVDIRFEQNMAIYADSSSTRTLTLGGANTSLVLESPTINGSISLNATTINNKLTFTTANGYIVFDYEPSTGSNAEYTNEVPLLKVDHAGTEKTILSRLTNNAALAIGNDDTVAIVAGDTKAVIKDNYNYAGENIVFASEGGFIAYGFPNNDPSWSNRNVFEFRAFDATAANNGLYIGDGGSTQFIDLSRNLKNIGTVTASGKISGGEIEGTSLDINGTSDISGNAVFHGKSSFGATTSNVYNVHAKGTGWAGDGIAIEATTTNGAVLSLFNTDRHFQIASRGSTLDFRDITDSDTRRFYVDSTGNLQPGADSSYSLGTNTNRWENVYADTLYGDGSNITGVSATDNTKLPLAGGTMTGDITLSTDADILKAGTNPFRVFTNGTLALSVSASQNATFAGSVSGTSLVAPDVYAQNLYIASSGTSAVNRIDNDNNQLYITYGGTSNRALEISNSNGNATFAGDITFGDSHFIGDDSFDNLHILASSGENVVIQAPSGNSIDLKTAGGSTLNLDSSQNATFAGEITSGRLNITDAGVPIKFTESGNTGTGKYWRQVLDAGDIRFDVDTTSTNGDGSFSSYNALIQLNADGHTDINGNLDVGGGIDVTGNITVSGTVDGVDIAALAAANTGDQDLSSYAPLASPALTGNPTAPTQSAGNNTTRIATTAFVSTAVSNLIDNAPDNLNTLNELAEALNDDDDAIVTINTALGNRYTKTESDAKYLLNTTDTLTGVLTLAHSTSAGLIVKNSGNSGQDASIVIRGARNAPSAGVNPAKLVLQSYDSDAGSGTNVTGGEFYMEATSLTGGGLTDFEVGIRYRKDGSLIDGFKIHDGTFTVNGNIAASNFSGSSSGTNTGDQDLSSYYNSEADVTQHEGALSIGYDQLTGTVPTWNQDTTGSAGSVAWGNITGKPSTFAPSSHTHDDRYYTESEIQTFFNRGYISRHHETNLAVGWYTIATNTGDRALGEFQIWDTASSDHQSVLFNASHHFGTNSSNDITVLANSRYSGTNFRYIRIKENSTYDGAALQVYVDGTSNSCSVAIVGGNAQESGWVIKDWIADATDPGDVSGWASFTESCKVDLDNIINGGIATTGLIYSAPSSGTATAQYRVLTQADEGSGNGIDADTLDGQHASAFQAAGSYAAASHTHAATDITSGTLSTDRLDSSVIFGNNSSGTNEGNFDNWNNLSKTGFYSDDNATGKWSTANWSSVMHFKLYDNNNNYASQLGFDTYNADFFYRMKNNGTWTDWYEVYHEGHKPTPAEIGAAASSHTHAAGDITSGTFANARISESSVTQHVTGITSAQSQKLGYITVTQAVDLDDVESKAALGNTAYGWGNHASAGYLTSFDITTQTDSKYIRSNTSDNVTGHTEWQDDYHVRLGNSADMRLYHSSGNNYIDCHTGSLYIRTNANTDVGGDIHLRPRSSENGVIVRDDAEVELYYNNALKMETTSSGITVLGNVDSNGNVGNLNTTDDIGQQMEYGNTDVATLRCDANRWRVYFGGGGQSREAFTVEEGGEVGIGDSTPSYKLDVAGTIRATGDVIAYSDERVKENIKTIDNSLEKVNKLRGVEFNKIGEDKKSIGVIAQEIEKVLPEVVKTDDEGMKSVAYGNVVGVLIEAVKELNKEVEELKTKLNNGN